MALPSPPMSPPPGPNPRCASCGDIVSWYGGASCKWCAQPLCCMLCIFLHEGNCHSRPQRRRPSIGGQVACLACSVPSPSASVAPDIGPPVAECELLARPRSLETGGPNPRCAYCGHRWPSRASCARCAQPLCGGLCFRLHEGICPNRPRRSSADGDRPASSAGSSSQDA